MTTKERKIKRLEKAIESSQSSIKKLNYTLEDEFSLSIEGNGNIKLGRERISEKIQNLESKVKDYQKRINNL